MLQQNEDFLTQIWSLIILKDNYRSATDVFISSHQYSTYKYWWCHHRRTNFHIWNFCFAVYIKDDYWCSFFQTGSQNINNVVLWLKIFFPHQLLSASKPKVVAKVDVVWIIIITIFIIIYNSYIIICSVPSVNTKKNCPIKCKT